MTNITDTYGKNEKASRVSLENLFQNKNWFGKLLIVAFVAFQGWMAIELYQLKANVRANTEILENIKGNTIQLRADVQLLLADIQQLHVDLQQLHSQAADIDRKLDKVLLLLGDGAQPYNN